MKDKSEIIRLLDTINQKELERILGIKIRNGQTTMGIRSALKWVLS